MLADPRAETLATNFAFQWLNLQRLDEVQPDSNIFPYASGSGDPRTDYVTETSLFVNSIFKEDRSVVDLLTANHTYLNERVASLYGIRECQRRPLQARRAHGPRRVGGCSAKAPS